MTDFFWKIFKHFSHKLVLKMSNTKMHFWKECIDMSHDTDAIYEGQLKSGGRNSYLPILIAINWKLIYQNKVNVVHPKEATTSRILILVWGQTLSCCSKTLLQVRSYSFQYRFRSLKYQCKHLRWWWCLMSCCKKNSAAISISPHMSLWFCSTTSNPMRIHFLMT